MIGSMFGRVAMVGSRRAQAGVPNMVGRRLVPLFKSGARHCAATAVEAPNGVPKPTNQQLRALCLAVGIPMVGFGFADNFIMIIAGDLIGASLLLLAECFPPQPHAVRLT